MPTYSQLINKLPYRLKARFESLGGYVQSLIDDQETKTAGGRHLSDDETSLIKVLIFIGTLDGFFREGSAAARSAVSSFEKLGMKGFRVGTTAFEGENENVRRGDTLSSQLRKRTHLMRRKAAFVDIALNNRNGIPNKVRELVEHLRNGKKTLD